LASWLKIPKGGKRAIFTAASLAEEAVRYLRSLQPEAQQRAA
jgi:antirestriction protein ArdC